MSELLDIRKRLGLSQTEFGYRLGLSLRAYQDLEAKDAIRPAYVQAAEYVAFFEAWVRKEPMLASAKTRQMAVELSRALVGG